MVAAPDLGSGAARRGGSSPFIRTRPLGAFLFGLRGEIGKRCGLRSRWFKNLGSSSLPAGTMQHILDKAEQALNQIRPYLISDGGDVNIIELSADMVLKIELVGACKTCTMRHMTMKSGIEETLRREVPEIKAIIEVKAQTL